MILVKEEAMPSDIPGITKHVFTEYQISQIEKLSDNIVVLHYESGLPGTLYVFDTWYLLSEVLDAFTKEGRCYINANRFKDHYKTYDVDNIYEYILFNIVNNCAPEDVENEIDNLFDDPQNFIDTIDEYLANKGGG